jgi:hypothetical protein
MRTLFILLFLFCFVLRSCAQVTITTQAAYANPPISELIQGLWVNINDTNCYILFTEDSLLINSETLNSKPEEQLWFPGYENYNYALSFHDSNATGASGPASLIKWQGNTIVMFHDTLGFQRMWTIPLYSVDEKYLRLGSNGENIYKRKE